MTEVGESMIERAFLQMERARASGRLIKLVHTSDKEFHFQNWVAERLHECAIEVDDPGRNTYPDFRFVREPIGIEVKGLKFPGRETNYDSNSQVPTGEHNGRTVYYVFGRYPADVTGLREYPVVDLVMCHGDFLNAQRGYAHVNRNFKGFGSYGDIMVRDRKMYVARTPYNIAAGTSGLATLIVPDGAKIASPRLVKVGTIERKEVNELVASYEFDLQTNEILTHMVPNPNAGKVHRFGCYRVSGRGDDVPVSLA